MSIARAREHLRGAQRPIYRLCAYDGLSPALSAEAEYVREAIMSALAELDGPLLSEAIPVTVEEGEGEKPALVGKPIQTGP